MRLVRSQPLINQKSLSDEDRKIYEWQMWVPDFGEEGQQLIKNSTVLISRCGGLGSVVAYELASPQESVGWC
jgi:molybdopterin/thiamine biosynthesis adenylyltransferase